MIFIYPPTIDWGWMKQRPQQLMTRLARAGHTVFFCNPTWVDREVEEVEPRLYIVHRHEQWTKHDWPLFRQLHGTGQPVIVWCSFPKLALQLQQWNPDLIIYDCVDEFAEWLPFEPDMINIANGVVCTSERLFARIARCYPSKSISLIRNGYDADMSVQLAHAAQTRKVTLPEDLPERGLARAAYIGAWAPWVDDVLLRKLTDSIKELEVIVIGPEFGKPFPRQAGDSRLRFLGLKRHTELASYMHNVSVLLLPFRINPVTLSTDPVKLYEYLASGKPVVATAIPEAGRLTPEVDIARSHQEFIACVRHRLQQPGDSAARHALAQANTWEHRASQAEQLLRELLQQ